MRRSFLRLALAGMLALGSARGAKAHVPVAVSPSTIALEQIVTPRATTNNTPIFMYHHIGETEDRFTVSPERLRSHIDSLCTGGYGMQTFSEYARGDKTTQPSVVLTFDDSTQDQFRILPNGRIDPTSAVGVLEGARRVHSSCNVTATFFVNATTQQGLPAFEQPGLEGQKLQWLQHHGYEVGAHGAQHRDFQKLTPTQARADTQSFQKWLNAIAPDVRVDSFAYPYGSIPAPNVQRVIDERFAYSAHAWGGVARTGEVRLVPRIETSSQTVLAQYARITPGVQKIATQQVILASDSARESPLRFTSPLANLHGNAYKWSAVRAMYARNDPQLPPQPPRLLWRPDDRRRGWRGESRISLEARRQESGLFNGQEADQWRSTFSTRQFWRPARFVRDRYAWSSDWFSRRDPVSTLPITRYRPYRGTPTRSDTTPPLKRPVAITPKNTPAWYDVAITHGPVNAVLAARVARGFF